jgi:uncharacterized radical SAM superfamily Fe-S cluster-containing enzyme
MTIPAHFEIARAERALHRMCDEGGRIKDLFSGHYSKRELYERMHAWLRGYEAKGEA